MSNKYYVVWKGHRPGIYETWEECEAQVKGFPGAEFKSFKSLNDADAAFLGGKAAYSVAQAIVDDGQDLPGWKPDNEYPEEIQAILRKIKNKQIHPPTPQLTFNT